MKRVANNTDQVNSVLRHVQDVWAGKFEGTKYRMVIEYKRFVPPRTDPQRKKVYAMIGDLADFTGDANMKEWVKGMSFWPHVYLEHANNGKLVPKSEALLSKEESSNVIEHLYVVGSQLPGFEWSE